jgi:glycosyltransferase involved in cell wall biosynthesis
MDVLIVGPVPPPVDGRAMVTSWFIQRTHAAGHHVDVVDTHVGAMRKALRCLHIALAMLCGRVPDRLVLIASGEAGLVTEAVTLAASRIRRVPTSLMHHSAHYVRGNSTFLRLAVAAGGPRMRHVVLDENMGSALAARYRIDPDRIVVVDNAGLMPLPPAAASPAPRSGLVHLSNLSVAKGLGAVLEVADRTGVRVRLIGSVGAEVSSILDDARRRGVPFEAIGPRHGQDKLQELSQARCFLFLSSYHHEAQPLVLYEAVSMGCLPIVWRTGWIGEQMHRLGLGAHVLEPGDIDGAARLVSDITTMDAPAFETLSRRARTAFAVHRNATMGQFEAALVVDGATRRSDHRV